MTLDIVRIWNVSNLEEEILGDDLLSKVKRFAFFARLGTFLFFVPLILFLIFLDFKNYLFLNILIFIFSGFAAKEVNDLLKLKFKFSGLSSILSFFLGFAPPILTYIHFNVFYLGMNVIYYLFIALVFSNWIVDLVFIKEHEIGNFLSQATSILFILIYPGVLMSFTVSITTLPKAPFLMLMLFAMVSGNDTFAYLFGYFLGKNSYRPTIISPNKTLMGFFGGILFSVLTAIFAVVFRLINLSYGESIILGILIGVFTIIGDLFESGLKRSAGVKDSGKIVPGRGGALDSIDSFLLTGPIFYLYLS